MFIPSDAVQGQTYLKGGRDRGDGSVDHFEA